jgi:REP element-mobilizing transposase RayT
MQSPGIAEMISQAIRFRETEMKHCRLHGWVVMPNHVHVLLTPLVPVSKLTQSLKRYTAAEANRMLGIRGTFWQDESYDRVVRDGEEFGRVWRYVVMNPVKAGLVREFREYQWSSENLRWAD